jgi:hypothetical protein
MNKTEQEIFSSLELSIMGNERVKLRLETYFKKIIIKE